MKTRALAISLVAAVLLTTNSLGAARQPTLEDLLKYRSLNAVEIAPDGRRAAVVVAEADYDENTFRTNIYLVQPGGSAVKLTNGPRHDSQPRWSPDGKWIAFLSDRDNKPARTGKQQVWMISPDGGEAWQLTHDRTSVTSLEWSPDGNRIAILATEPDPEDLEKRVKEKDDAVVVERDMKMGRIYLVGVPDGKQELLYAAPDRHIAAISFSPKGDQIAFADQPSPRVPDAFHSVVRVIAIAGKQVREVAGGDLSYSAPKWSPDGIHLAFNGGPQTDWAANNYLYVAPAAGGKPVNITRALDEEVGSHQWMPDSSGLIVGASKGMDAHFYRATLDGKVTQVDDFEEGLARSPSLAKGAIAFIRETPSAPADVYFSALSGKFAAARASDFNPQVRDLALGRTQVVRWKNKQDGMAMDGLLVTPPDYREGRAYPLLLVIHGGPAGQFSKGFALRRGAYPVQVFASQGYVVFMPNPRGSGGYGEKFRQANLKDWGGADYRDIQDGLDDLVARGIADKDRLGVMGWSYGGFMTSWTITQTQRFRAASVGAGVTNLYSMYGTTDIPPFQVSYFGAPPWEARDLYMAHSAMTFVGRVTTPTLIQHGYDDRRVPFSQGEEFYTALRSRGDVPVEMVRYPRMPHGFNEPRLVRDSMQRNLEWFDRYVRGNREAAARWHTPPAAWAEKTAVGQ